MKEFDPSRPRFYFSLLRLMALLRGADATRAETNEPEAWLAGVAMYLISFLFFAQFIPTDRTPWLTALSLIVLTFLVLLFWLLVLYFNSLVIKLLRPAGFFQSIPIRRAQSILLGLCATTMALDLARGGSWMGEIAGIWLVAVALNLAAAIILAFRNGTRTE